MNRIVKIILIAVAVVTAIPSFAVSDKEMEQARAIAAKHYLRYANNGSDYLDALNPTSVAELSKSLKAKEQENIKSFNAVATPKDYASWDKAKLVEYWSKTFFNSPGLKEDGKKCLSILNKKLSAMEVKASAAPTAAAQPAQEQPTEQPTEPQAVSADQTAGAPADNIEELIADSQGVADTAEEEVVEDRPQKQSGTVWYVAILVLLIGVVVWLVMYAQKSMKETGKVVAEHKNGEHEIREARRAAKEEVNKMRDQYAASISAKNDEIKQLRSRCEALEEELERLRQEQNQRQEQSQKRPAAPTRQQTQLPPVVYLGHVNQKGLFVKASRSLNEESSVYRMDIPDGTHGEYSVVNDPSILDRLLGDPATWLGGGCTIENPEDADIATDIVTISQGQAIFADNTCRVTKKARIKFI